jgi:hypothetical protein
MSKAMIQYTTRDLKELGLFVEVPGRTDTDKNRKKAIEEIQRRMEDPEDPSLNSDSFANGLSTEDLIVVEPPLVEELEDHESEIIQAVKAIATLASLRVSLEEVQHSALELRPLIEALFAPEPLTAEQMQQATDRMFAKTLIKFAEAKAAHDQFLPIAEAAWEVLAPALPAATKRDRAGNHSEDPQTTTNASKALPDATKNRPK